MAHLELAGGAVIDIATGDEVRAVGSKLDSILGAHKRWSYPRLMGQADPTSSALPTFIDLGGPPDGFLWEVRSVVIVGPSGPFGAAVAQPVAVFITPEPLTNISSIGIADLGTATPVSFLYPSHGMIAQAPERLVVGVLATAGQVAGNVQFLVTGRAVQKPVDSQSDVDSIGS